MRALRVLRFDFELASLITAVMALAWILALAGAAFAVRMMLVLCFTTLAGRARSFGVPTRAAMRVRRQRANPAVRR